MRPDGGNSSPLQRRHRWRPSDLKAVVCRERIASAGPCFSLSTEVLRVRFCVHPPGVRIFAEIRSAFVWFASSAVASAFSRVIDPGSNSSPAKTGDAALTFVWCCCWHNSNASRRTCPMRAELNQARTFSQSWSVNHPRWSCVSSERYRNIQDTWPSFLRTRARCCFTSSTSRGSCAWTQYYRTCRRSNSPEPATLITLNQIMPSGQRPRVCPGEAMVSVEMPRSDPSDSFIAQPD